MPECDAPLKKRRRRLHADEIAVLEAEFAKDANMTYQRRLELACQLNMS